MFQVQGCSEPDPLLATLEKYACAYLHQLLQLLLYKTNQVNLNISEQIDLASDLEAFFPFIFMSVLFLRQETVEQLLSNIFDKEKNESAIVSVIQILLTLFETRRPAYVLWPLPLLMF